MTETKKVTIVDPEQPNLAPLPDEVQKDETEIQALIRRTTMDALTHKDGITEKDVERMITARLRIIEMTRAFALKLTRPEDWTLWKDNEGHVVATPRASAMLRVRPWLNVSVYNHRSLDGDPEQPTEAVIEKGEKKERVTVLEMLCDVRLGKEVMEGIYQSVRSDDKFIGRADRSESHGGPREQDLRSCIRTMIDKKAIASIIGFTKIPEADLKAAGHNTALCYRGSGYGSSQDRTASGAAQEGVRDAANVLWLDIVRCVNGKLDDARTALKDCTKYNSFKGRDGNQVAAFDGIDSPEKFTTTEKVLKAAEKWKKHPLYAGPPEAEEAGGQS